MMKLIEKARLQENIKDTQRNNEKEVLAYELNMEKEVRGFRMLDGVQEKGKNREKYMNVEEMHRKRMKRKTVNTRKRIM